MAMQYLFPPTTQFQARTGANLTAGFLRVYYTQTDDRAPTYSDFGGTVNEDDIVLDNDGRAVVIVDDTKTYRLEVYTYNGSPLFTVDPLSAVGGGGGSSNIVKIISSDGTVKVQAVSGGGITYYDLSTALTPTASKWGNVLGTVSGLDGTNDWEEITPTVTIGTSTYDYGWTASKDTGYDIAASVEMPSGVAGALYGIEVKCEIQVDGVTVQTEYGYIDPSESMGRVSFEWKGQLSDNQKVDCKLYAKCAQALTVDLAARALFNEECDGIVGNGGGGGGATYEAGQYIDINSANVISVTGVQPASAMVFYAPNSALSSKQDTLIFNYNGPNISGINGSAIDAGAFNFSAGDYIDISGNVISVTGLQPVSGMSSYVEQSAFDDCCSSMSGQVSAISGDVSAISAIVSSISGQTGDFVEKSAISAESSVWNTVTGKQDSGNYLSATESSNYILTSQSGLFQPSGYYQPSGDYLTASASSNFIPTSESANYYPTSNPSGFISGVDLSDYATTAYVDSAVSGVEITFDTSMTTASSTAGVTAGVNPDFISGKQDISAMSAYVPFSAVESTTASAITAIGGSAIKGHEYTGVAPVVVDNVTDEISVQHSSLTVDSSMTAYESAGSIVLGVNQSALDLSSYVAKSSISGSSATWNTVTAKLDTSAYSSVSGTFLTAVPAGYATESYVDSAVSGKLDATASSQFITSLPADLATTADVASAVSGKLDTSASGEFYPITGNPSGFLTAHQSLAGYATEQYVDSSVSGKLDSTAYDSAWFAPASGMSAYAYESSLSAKLDASASSEFYSTANPSGFLVADDITAKADASSLADYQPTSAMTAYQSSGDYAFNSALSSKLDASASSQFITSLDGYATTEYVDSSVSSKQDISAMTAYQSAGDYAYNSSLSSKLDATASSEFYPTSNPSGFLTGIDLSDYQLTADMSAYQLSGDYAYNSSLADYQPTSAMTAYQPSGDYAYTSALADYQPVSAMSAYQPSGDYADASSLSAKMDASASSEFYLTSNPSGFITGVDLSNYATTSYVDSSVSSKLDATASADFYSTSNPSGFITGVDLSDYQPVSAMTAYQVSGDYYSATNPSGFITGVDLSDYATTAYVDSSVSGKLDASASSDFYSTSNPSGFITGVDLSNYATTSYVDSSVSGKQDVSGMTAYQPVGTYIYESALGWAEV